MKKIEVNAKTLRKILKNIHNPEWLNSHPWSESLFVQDVVNDSTDLQMRDPGEQLMIAITHLYTQMMPAVPPHQGKRLDSRWGEFGLLAAMYFAQLEFGMPQPTSLRDAWGRIDQAILSFRFREAHSSLSATEIAPYLLVSNEVETGPASTISDWHRRGIEHLAEIIQRKELQLRSLANSPEKSRSKGVWLLTTKRWFRWIILFSTVALLALVGNQTWQVYQRVQTVREHLEALDVFPLSNLNTVQVETTREHLSALRLEITALGQDAKPFLLLAPYLGWLPVYGGDLSQAPALLEMGTQLCIMGDEAFQALAPLIPYVTQDNNTISIPELLQTLKEGDSQLLITQVALSRARAIRQQIKSERLSEQTRTLLLEKVDPILLTMQESFPVDDVLQMARIAPRLLGAVENGPQTYLILLQNEDELRPTGGFLTAIGRMTIEDGHMTELSFEGVSKLDDFAKPFPSAPWQLDEYMRSEILILRDANWFTNYPTTVEWVEFLYAYTRTGEIDGVIAVDQNVVVEILREIGPVLVQGLEQPITAENVLEYIRHGRSESLPAGVDMTNWDRKGFINPIATAITQKILARQGYSLNALLQTLMRLLDEKHILLQFDDPEMKKLLAKRGWDGAVWPPASSDFLMVVDTNVGFNKTNLVVDRSLTYEVDLQDSTNPFAHLSVIHINRAQVELNCYQIPATVGIHIEQEYPFNDCYWNYLRVYTPAGSSLSGSTPHAIPPGRTLRETTVPARTDLLGNENINGTTVYGTFMVVPPRESLQTDFDLHLPQSVIEQNNQTSTLTYRLTVQKQPGTLAVPLSLSFLLPVGMQVSDSSHHLQLIDGAYTLKIHLRQDLIFYLVMAPAN